METKFDKKPTIEEIKNYCNKIAYFLLDNNITIIIDVNEIGPLATASVNGVITSQERWWLGDFNVFTPWGKLKLKSQPRFGIDDSVKDHDIWLDAVMIQDQVYDYFKLNRGNPDNHDGYWSLWKRII